MIVAHNCLQMGSEVSCSDRRVTSPCPEPVLPEYHVANTADTRGERLGAAASAPPGGRDWLGKLGDLCPDGSNQK